MSDAAEPPVEEPKRLALFATTARRLYILSGNQCAFPDCAEPLVNEHGDFIGQVAHIEGVRGERFNPQMTNEDRRAFENVVALCYPHHIETNDEDRFPVDVMRDMKARHEERFAGVMERIMNAPLRDLTSDVAPVEVQNLRRLDRVLSWRLTEDELAATAHDVRSAIAALATLPPATRGVLGVIVGRGHEVRGEIEILAFELEQVLGISRYELRDHVQILSRHGFAAFGDDGEGAATVGTISDRAEPRFYGSEFWIDLRQFCEAIELDVATVVADLDFAHLDE